jgi:hypothetical protein
MPMTSLNLAAFDRDGAIEETAHAAGATRADFFKRTGVATVGMVAAGTVFEGLLSPAHAAISSKPSKANDVKILNYALTLEYLEAAFYREALNVGGYSGSVLRFAQTVYSHEATHVSTLRGVLGSAAVAEPSFDFKGTTRKWSTFLRTAKVLEDTGVAAYQGQAHLIHQNAVLAPAGAILAVEARHAAWVRDLLYAGRTVKPAPEAFSTAMSMSQVLSAVEKTGFIKS